MQRDLVVRAQGGDVEAFSELTAGGVDRLYAVARLVLRHDEQAADAVHDALLKGAIPATRRRSGKPTIRT